MLPQEFYLVIIRNIVTRSAYDSCHIFVFVIVSLFVLLFLCRVDIKSRWNISFGGWNTKSAAHIISTKSPLMHNVPKWSDTLLKSCSKWSLTRIIYFPVIQRPMKKYSTLQEILRYSEESSDEIGQSHVIATFNLWFFMKTYPFVWGSPKYYERTISECNLHRNLL